ncbi:formate/nitrite transporter family protein [Brevibacillus nitrificans]|uniref:Formate/nitrite transporter family protein n=1 Tax=Brevibacillus nitrificans TaxID=651560 RepID=A0A3M8DLU5_9BACL|nr:formate/nitrite transporter family protein [Brevibacillus nitrificans]RNB88451.1 formate/nitrite transporter family protein [Brevibacillus nitrificans]
MSYHSPQRIAEITMETGTRKANLPLLTILILGFVAGAFISFGYLLDIRVTGNLPKEWGSFSSFLGAAVFPIGLMLVVIAGGELLTGNMMSVTLAMFAGRVSFGLLLKNWFWVTVSNLAGAVFVAYFFGHVAGLITKEPFLTKTLALADGKLHESFVQAFWSGIGCNWLVALGVWLSYAAEDVGGKILGIWFPIMAFVAIGFQHVVANMFIIPAAIFAGHATWGDWFSNFVPVFLGNAVGGGIFVAFLYYIAYIKGTEQSKLRASAARKETTKLIMHRQLKNK